MTVTGTVKWFNTQKRFGFIAPDDGSDDIFVHISALEKIRYCHFDTDQKVSFEIETKNLIDDLQST